MQIISDCKRKVIAVLDEVFPEFTGFFSDTFGKSSLAILRKWPTAESLARARIDSIEKCLSKASKNKFGRTKAEELKALAKNSFAFDPHTSAQVFLLEQLIAQIEFSVAQMASLDKKLDELLNEMDSPITTIPGIGPVCGATILGEIGDIARFSHHSQLVAFTGYDPSVYESGNFKGDRNHISKRGSRYLRWAL